MKSASDNVIVFSPEFAFLPGTQAAVSVVSSTKTYVKPASGEVSVTGKSVPKDAIGFVKWGKNNKTPNEIKAKVFANEMTATNLKNAVEQSYGGGIVTGIYEQDANGNLRFVYREFDQWKEFLKYNDVPNFLMKLLFDLNMYYTAFAELLIAPNRNVTGISLKQAIYSRMDKRNSEGQSKYHYYSGLFYEGKNPTGNNDVVVTPLLDEERTLEDAMRRMGKLEGTDGKKKDLKDSRLIVPVYYPTGEPYYQIPHWWSMFESGWYDFAISIPKFKKAIMANQMTVKYHILIHEDYFPTLFALEGITDEKTKKARQKKELQNFNNFLSKPENTGKSLVSYRRRGHKELEDMVEIKTIENHYKGGEYIEDAEESSNILSYAMGQHPSLNGSAPGKNKTISGSEARELFIMKQAMMKPMRDLALKPFYIIKALNGWPDEMQFGIVNTVLTTLDKGTGSEKTIS